MPDDTLNAFCRDNNVTRPGATQGPLHGLSFAAKDVFDVEGTRTGFGHPTWLETHPPATKTAFAITRLLEAGAALTGRTISDELCYSIAGDNSHYGIPINPRAPDRLPGGSSSGSAAATAGGLVDFALGTDCGGSVRVPASYCGLFGLRPTHGRIALDGISRFAPRFDTVGWFARDAALLQRVGEAFFGKGAGAGFTRMVVLDDAFARADAPVRAALEPSLARIEAQLGACSHMSLAPDRLDDWLETFRITQAGEIWASLGEWITEHRPVFGKGVGERFEAASKVEPQASAAARIRADAISTELDARIGECDLLCLPTSPCIAPLRGMASDAVEIDYRRRTMALLCIAGLGGLPQLTIPVGTVDGAPVGLSIMARRCKDSDLLDLAANMFAHM